jgi:hypothetical protein
LDAALKEIDNRTGHYKIHDYIHDQVKELAQQLDNPMGWQHMDIGQLRAMVQNRFTRTPTRECRGRHSGGYPKQAPPAAPGSTSPGTTTGDATGTAAAPGTHSAASMGSADVLQQQQAIFDQQALQNQAEQQEQQSDQSAVSWNQDQETPDWGGQSY